MSQSRNSNSTIAVGRDHEAAALDIRDDVVKEQLIKQVQKNFNIPILINSVITILMMVVLRDVVAAHILFSWGLISLGWNAICYLYHRRFDDSSAQFTELLRWVHSFSISVGITGLLWGVAGILFFQPDYPQFQVFLAFVLGGLAAGAVVAYAFWLPAFYAFVAPSLLPLVIRFGYEQDELSILMGGMLALFVVTISFLARSSHESLAKSILLQVDKQILLDEITKSEEKYRNLVELSHDLIWSVDTDGNYTFVNQASSITHGYEPDEMIGKPFSEFMTPEQAKLDLVVFEQIKKGEKYIELETIHQRKDGSPVHLSFNAVVAYDEEGNVIGTTGTAKDLTSRKLSEEQSRV